MFTPETPNMARNRHRSLSHTTHCLAAITKWKCSLLNSETTEQQRATGETAGTSTIYYDRDFGLHENSAATEGEKKGESCTSTYKNTVCRIKLILRLQSLKQNIGEELYFQQHQ